VKKLNLYFGKPITKEQWPRVVNALRTYCPGVVWAGGDNLDVGLGSNTRSITVNFESWGGLECVIHRSNDIISPDTMSVMPRDFPKAIDGWKWVDEYTTDFDTTSDIFDTLYESSDVPNGLIEIGYDDLKEGMTVIVNGAAGRIHTWDTGRIHTWDNEIARIIYFDDKGDYINPLLLFDSWNDGHEGPLNESHDYDNDTEGTPMFPACEEHKCWFMMPDYKVKYYIIDSFDPFDSLNESEEPKPTIGSTLYCHKNFGGFKVGEYYTVTAVERCYEDDCIKINNTDFRLTINPDHSDLSYKTWFTLVDYDETTRLFDILNESTDTNYKPKLVLKFNPPVKRWDEMEQILTFIESLYPNTYWYGDKKLKPQQKNIVESCGGNGVWYLHIGYYPHNPNHLTYGSNEYGYEWSDIAIDGYKWYEDNKFDTQEAFNSLYESKEDGNIKYFNLIFNPPLASGEWPLVTEIIKELFPGRTWCNDEPLEWFPDTYGDTITTLSLSKDGISYGMRQDEIIRNNPSFNGRYWIKYKGIQIPNGEIDYNETTRLFDSLNESTDYMGYQPKLNLKFDPPISDNNDWFRAKEVLILQYPGLLWRSGKQVESDYNPLFSVYEDDYVHYLIIGNEEPTHDRLSYSEQLEQDEDYDYIDGWEWVRHNAVDYDETSRLFDSLNESKADYNKDDKAYCHTDLIMDDGNIEAYEGKSYEIIRANKYDFHIIDESGDEHRFDIDGEDNYTNWFTIVPKGINPEEVFGVNFFD